MSKVEQSGDNLNSLKLLYIHNRDDFFIELTDELKESFSKLYVANSESEGLNSFIQQHPDIVVIDTDSEGFGWIDLSQHIIRVRPETKVIVLTDKYEEKELYDAIDIGIDKLIKKPTEKEPFLKAIESSIEQIGYLLDREAFHTYMHSPQYNPDSMVLIYKENKIVLSNDQFLDFFDVESVKEFINRFGDIGDLLLKHDGFLYNQKDKNWFDEVSKNEYRLYYSQIKDKKQETRQFLLKYHSIDHYDSYNVLSLNDITELHIDEIFSEEISDSNLAKVESSLSNLLQLAHTNKIKLHLFNYYKGLTIIRDATIEKIEDDGTITIITDYMQQKAIQHEGRTLISSELLPTTISCDKIMSINFEKHTVKIKNIHFTFSSPATRETLRLQPDNKHTVSIFFNKQNQKQKQSIYKGLLTIEDISLNSIKISFKVRYVDLNPNDKVILDVVLPYRGRSLIINTEAVVFKKMKTSIVFLYDLSVAKKHILLQYIHERQLEIVKEFKSL